MRRFRTALVLAGLAGLSALVFGVAHGLGWRAATSVIAGNSASADDAFHGLLYTVAWLQMWLLAPILALTAAGLASWEVLAPRLNPPADPSSRADGRGPSGSA